MASPASSDCWHAPNQPAALEEKTPPDHQGSNDVEMKDLTDQGSINDVEMKDLTGEINDENKGDGNRGGLGGDGERGTGDEAAVDQEKEKMKPTAVNMEPDSFWQGRSRQIPEASTIATEEDENDDEELMKSSDDEDDNRGCSYRIWVSLMFCCSVLP